VKDRDDRCIRRLPDVIEGASAVQSSLASRTVSNVIQVTLRWGGWGSNPRPADYGNYGHVHSTHYLHGYHRAVSPMALIAPLARMTRSTNRSTPTTAITECQLQNVTVARPASMPARGGIRPPVSAAA
jgi:hypothetical protein